MNLDFVLREVTDEDTDFLYSSYLKHFHRGHPVRYVPDTLYYKPQSARFAFLLDRAEALIACFPEDPREIAGWALYEYMSDALVLHYIYVRAKYRKKGIGRQLLDAIKHDKALCIASHACDEFSSLRHKAAPMRVVYDHHLVDGLRLMYEGIERSASGLRAVVPETCQEKSDVSRESIPTGMWRAA